MKRLLALCIMMHMYTMHAVEKKDLWRPTLTEQDMKIAPRTGETAAQYAHRKVHEMIKRYADRRIVGSYWLSEYWKHHYWGALEWRNYYWTYN